MRLQTSGHTYVMGILNVTPDSFSDGGRWNHMDDALFHAQRMIEEGADILDIGGESIDLRLHTNFRRRGIFVWHPLSRHWGNGLTFRFPWTPTNLVLQAAAAGADLINDIWGLKADKKMAEVIAKAKASCLCMDRETMDYTNFFRRMLYQIYRR